jgi:hypothetical protein
MDLKTLFWCYTLSRVTRSLPVMLARMKAARQG